MNIVSVYEKFPTESDCINYLEQVRWSGTPVCPYCKSDRTTPLPEEHRHHCNNCNTSFSVTVGTIFHHTHLPLQKWFLALTLILNAKKGIAARQLARDLDVHRNTAWYLSMRIRNAMAEADQRSLLTGIVEMDETYIGGKPRKGDGKPHKRGRGTDKIPVVGMIERNGEVRCAVMRSKQLISRSLCALVREHVNRNESTLITDEYRGYMRMSWILPHETVNHKVWYVDGDLHTNNIESFWSLLKRGIVGQFHKVSVRHLPQYVDEFCYRHNHRENNDLFALTIARGLGVAL
ncbi:IS1595 family transposase [bacterium]|nr:IS1595 family transposase [bacterium]